MFFWHFFLLFLLFIHLLTESTSLLHTSDKNQILSDFRRMHFDINCSKTILYVCLWHFTIAGDFLNHSVVCSWPEVVRMFWPSKAGIRLKHSLWIIFQRNVWLRWFYILSQTRMNLKIAFLKASKSSWKLTMARPLSRVWLVLALHFVLKNGHNCGPLAQLEEVSLGKVARVCGQGCLHFIYMTYRCNRNFAATIVT